MLLEVVTISLVPVEWFSITWMKGMMLWLHPGMSGLLENSELCFKCG